MLAQDAPAVRGDCHTIMHAVGSATLARYNGDAAGSDGAQGSMVCGSGFYHGLDHVRAARDETRTAARREGQARCAPTARR